MLVFSRIFGRYAALASIAFVLLTACSGSSSPDPAVVAAEFSAQGIKGTVNGQNITLDLSGLGNCATTVENMAIGINANGASMSPDPRIARDYSQPVQFTLTAPDGTKAVYTVTVKGAACATTTPVKPCSAETIASTGYSLVFKGCSAANVAEYYDKTECVRDNATGLIWQGQTPAGTGLRANDQFKSNYDSTIALQKNDPRFLPIYSAPTQAEIDDGTNSIGFKKAVNASNLCGSGSWRLPTRDELIGLAPAPSYALDLAWFSNISEYEFYWSSSSVSVNDSGAWAVGFFGGRSLGVSGRDRSAGDKNGFFAEQKVLVRLVH
jgi:Protein of unknown function (DUF1566)